LQTHGLFVEAFDQIGQKRARAREINRALEAYAVLSHDRSPVLVSVG
jgi:hypothetical protein